MLGARGLYSVAKCIRCKFNEWVSSNSVVQQVVNDELFTTEGSDSRFWVVLRVITEQWKLKKKDNLQNIAAKL